MDNRRQSFRVEFPPGKDRPILMTSFGIKYEVADLSEGGMKIVTDRRGSPIPEIGTDITGTLTLATGEVFDVSGAVIRVGFRQAGVQFANSTLIAWAVLMNEQRRLMKKYNMVVRSA